MTWREQNALIVQFEDFAGAYMVILYLIVLGITATVVTNTLVMAVFERTREIGILSAIGMKGRGIMAQFLAEATLLATWRDLRFDLAAPSWPISPSTAFTSAITGSAAY
jgi:ABC-type lipoprotein release transport system permease subunit